MQIQLELRWWNKRTVFLSAWSADAIYIDGESSRTLFYQHGVQIWFISMVEATEHVFLSTATRDCRIYRYDDHSIDYVLEIDGGTVTAISWTLMRIYVMHDLTEPFCFISSESTAMVTTRFTIIWWTIVEALHPPVVPRFELGMLVYFSFWPQPSDALNKDGVDHWPGPRSGPHAVIYIFVPHSSTHTNK